MRCLYQLSGQRYPHRDYFDVADCLEWGAPSCVYKPKKGRRRAARRRQNKRARTQMKLALKRDPDHQ